MNPEAENSRRSHLYGSRKFRLPIFSRLKKFVRSRLFLVAIGLFTALIFSQNTSSAMAATAPSCANYVGLGGTPGSTTNQAGHGCVIIKYISAGVTNYETFNYTGADQSWSSPTGVTSATFYLVGAGGGALNVSGTYGPGGSGGFSTGTYALSGVTNFKIIVGQGGYSLGNISTYGGGGAGGGASGGYGSGGGRSAIRLAAGTSDLITAGGGGGGGYNNYCGGAGGGVAGGDAVPRNNPDAKGGTQSAGGAGGFSINSLTGNTGAAYQGGAGRDESGGGGGGYFGGGGGGDNSAGGGGSGFIGGAGITGGSTVAGSCTGVGNSAALAFTITYDGNGNTGGAVPTASNVNAFASANLATNTGSLTRTNFTFAGWNTAADGSGSSYASGATGIYFNGDATLYAQWNSTITYNGNGNTSGAVPAVTIAKGDAANTTLATNSGTLARTYYVFDGWNTAADGTGASHAAGATNFPSPGNITLFAQWEPVIVANAIPPKITGTYSLASTLTGSDGTWTDATGATTTRQWQSSSDGVSWTDINGANNSTFTVTSSEILKYLRFKVTKSTPTGTVSATNVVTGGTGFTGSTLFANASLSYKNASNVITQITQSTNFNWPSTCSGGPGKIGVRPGERLIVNLNTPQKNLIVNLFGDNVASEFKVNYQNGTSTTYTQSSQAYAVPPPENTQVDLKFPVAFAQRRGGNVNVPVTSPTGTSISGYEILWTTDTWSGCSGIFGFANAAHGFIKGAITYVGNGATGTVPPAIELVGPDSITFSLNSGSGLSKTGLNFVGWNTAADGSGTNYSGGASYTSTGSATLYAIFKPTVSYNANGAGSGSPERSTDVFLNSTTPTISTFPTVGSMVKTGYTFGGWSTTTTGTALTTPYSAASSITLYAVWNANNYAITFDANGATGTMANSAIVAGTAKALTANAFTRTGFTFQGWTTNADGTGTTYTNSQSVTLFANTTLYAKWLAGTFSVTFGNTPGTSGCIDPRCTNAGQVGQTMPNQAFTAGTPFTLSTNLWYRTGYVFAGWSTISGNGNPVVYADRATVTFFGNTTIYTQWNPVYTISYNANTGTGTVPASANSINGETVTVASNSGNLAKSGLTFAGWNTKADGTGKTYLAGSSLAPTANTTLFAMYLAACNPTRTTAGGYVVLTFTGVGNCLWVVPSTVSSIDLLIVGGGGGGGSSLGGGGGGGQVISQTGVTSIGTAIISVAAGGSGGSGSYTAVQNHGKTGGQSGFITPTVSSIAIGGSGGNGRSSASNLNPDGSAISTGYAGGGGAFQNAPAHIAIAGVCGNACIGGTGSNYGGGGGGGAGGIGIGSVAAANASAGGAGISNSISGSAIYYGGGGGAGKFNGTPNFTGLGGVGGGGNGSAGTNIGVAAGLSGSGNGVSGDVNSGGGGGGGYDGGTGGNGGTGVVVLRYEFGQASAPTITSITPSSGQLSVAFTAPQTDGGAAISNYQYSIDGGTTWVTPSPVQVNSPFLITGLTNGTTYPVVIRAFNGKAGVSSNLVSGTTPLSAPTISAVAGNANATITVTAGAGATPTSYLVTALNNSGVALAGPITCTVTAPSTSCVISGLTNNTAYKFSAVAYKSSLTSPVSNVTAAVTPTSYTITYNGNNSTTNTTAEFTTGTPLILPTPVKNGYNFNGWFTASTGGTLVGQNGSSYSPAATGTLHAQWTGISYAITYNSNGSDGGSAPANGTFTTGSTAYSIAGFAGVLTKSGYTLTGWNTAANGSGIDYGPGLTNTTYSLSVNLTLFAKWSYTNFSVTYALNGGTGTLPTSGTKTIGETFTVAAATGLSKPGFSFGGWSDGTNTYRAGSVYTVGSANVTLTARWIALYLITFDKNGATSGSAPSGTTYVAGDTGISLPTAGGMSKSGYIFDGWSTTPTGSLATAPFTTNADVTLYAKWSLATISITFSAGLAGGVAPTLTSLPATTSAAFGSLFTLPTTDTATTTSAGNFVLVGWNDGSSTYRPGDTYRITAVPPTFTAQWVAIYTVRYSLNGGSSAVPVDATYLNNTGITTAAIPSRTGYNFLNWIDQSNETAGANAAYTVRDGHYLLYAVWSPIAYNITFSDNSVAGVSGIPAVQNGNLGEVVSLNSNKPSRAGYLFSNWTTNADGSGLAYGAGSQLILESADVTLYAQWSAATNTIIYSGTITSGALPSAQGAATGATAVLAASTGFTRTGYTFDKWSDGIDLYAAGANFTMPAANTLIIAQWILNAPNTPAAPTVVAGDSSATITVVPGSGNGGPATSYVVTAAPGGATCTVYSPATTCSISGLDNGTAYTFTSVAHNNSGSAGPSAPSNAVIPATKPTLVTSVSAVAGNTNAVVTFTAPSNNGGAEISSYTVTSSPGGFTCVLNAPFTTPLTCTVPGLSNGVAYTFTVSASNGAYTSDASASSVAVTPKTVPGAPTLSAATSSTTSPGSATVTVTSPGSNGGDAIISYTVTSSPGGFTCTVLAPNTSCIVEGLTPGVAYTFTAVARNSVPGTSAASVASNSITPVAKPSAPTNVIAAAGDEEVTVSFTAPSANGSPITSYKVIALTIDGVPISPEKSCRPAGNATSCTITGLDNERPYTFSVTATNAVDTSFASTASAVTTPKDRFPPNLLINGPPSGIDIVGSVLTSVAIFEGAPEPVVTYQWQRCSSETDLTTCAAISGATAATYTTVSTDEGKFIRVVATATNGVSPNAVATSPLSAEITGPPRATTPTTGITTNVNESYSLATVAFGGLAPIIYAITSGVLPAGLTFDTFTGNITGTPTTVGNATLVISATDQKNQSSSITFTLTVVDPNAAAPEILTAPGSNSTAGADSAAKAAAEKAAAEAAAKLAAEKAAAEAAAKLAAEKLAAEAAAKAAADRAAAAAAAKLAEDKIAAAQAAQAAAAKAAASAAAKIAAANAAQAAAKVASDKAAELAKTPTVSPLARQLAAAAAASARIQAAAAVKNAAAAAASEVAAKNAVVVAAKEVTISIGSLNSATANAAKSSTADVAAAAAKNAAELSAKAAAGEALAAKSAANAAARIAADAVTRAAAQQKAAAIAAELAQKKAQELAKATSEKAAAEKEAQKATATLALVLEEKAKLSDQLASTETAEEQAIVQNLINEVEKKVELAQEFADAAMEDASALSVVAAKSEESATQAAVAVQIKIKAAENANNIVRKANANSEKITALSIVAENAATSAKKVAKTIPRKAPKPVAPPVAANAPRPDALINISGLKPGQKIRVSVKVNIK